MSARCRCVCGCKRIDRELNDDTSALLMCLPCCMDRHRREIRTIDVNIGTIERLLDGKISERERRALTARLFGIIERWS